WRNIEQIGVAVEGDFCLGKTNALREGRTDKHERGSFRGVLRGKARGGFFGLAEDVRDFVFATNVGVAFELAEACRGEIDGAARSELRLDVADTSDHIAVEACARAGAQFEALAAVLRQTQLLEFRTRGFCDGAFPVRFGPEVMSNLGRICVAVALV